MKLFVIISLFPHFLLSFCEIVLHGVYIPSNEAFVLNFRLRHHFIQRLQTSFAHFHSSSFSLIRTLSELCTVILLPHLSSGRFRKYFFFYFEYPVIVRRDCSGVAAALPPPPLSSSSPLLLQLLLAACSSCAY